MATSCTLAEISGKLDLILSAVISNKTTLSIEEAAAYTGLAVSYVYKLTSTQQIPHYKPRGKMLTFDRAELDAWMKQNRVTTIAEIDKKAADLLASGG